MACKVKDVLATPSMSRQRPFQGRNARESSGGARANPGPVGLTAKRVSGNLRGRRNCRAMLKADRGNRAHLRNDKPLRLAGHRSLMSGRAPAAGFRNYRSFCKYHGRCGYAHLQSSKRSHRPSCRLGGSTTRRAFEFENVLRGECAAPRAHELGTQSGTSSGLVKANSSIVLRIGARSASPNSTASPPTTMISGSNKLTTSARWRPIREPQSDSIERAISSPCSTEAANAARLVAEPVRFSIRPTCRVRLHAPSHLELR